MRETQYRDDNEELAADGLKEKFEYASLCKKTAGWKTIRPFPFRARFYGFQIMSATVLPAGMNGMTCVL